MISYCFYKVKGSKDVFFDLEGKASSNTLASLIHYLGLQGLFNTNLAVLC